MSNVSLGKSMEVTDSNDSVHSGNDFIPDYLTAVIIWIKACISSRLTPIGKMGFEEKNSMNVPVLSLKEQCAALMVEFSNWEL